MRYEAADKNECEAKRKRRRRWLAIAVTTGFGLLVLAEGMSRYGLGLGDPPLYVADPKIEYLAKPGTYRRFGNLVQVNSRHMRSEEFPEHKATPDELRVMMMGDSVVNGGALTDQQDLASQIVQEQLAAKLDRPVVVGNISAGSWGPGNLLAYVDKFGLCDADVVVLVLNSMDVGDNPSSRSPVGVDPTFPDATPPLAFAEALERYVFPKITGLLSKATLHHNARESSDSPSEQSEQSLDALTKLCAAITATGARQIWIHFPMKSEVEQGLSPAGELLRNTAERCGVPFLTIGETLKDSLRAGRDPYRPNDNIHPNAIGQQLLADKVIELVRTVLTEPGN